MPLESVLAAAVLSALQLVQQAKAPCEAATQHVRCAQHLEVAADSRDALLRPLASSSLTPDDLRGIGSSTDDWISYARRTIGSAVGEPRVVVDGLDSRLPIPAHLIARLSVNADPFAAEFTGVDQVRIEIDSRPPDRRWRFQTSLPTLMAGGGSLLAAAPAPGSRALSAGVSGPVPKTPLTFSLHASGREDTRVPLFASAASGTIEVASENLRTTSEAHSLDVRATWSTPRFVARAAWASDDSRATNAGVGGIHAASLGETRTTTSDRGEVSWRLAGRALVHRGGIALSRDRMRSTSDTSSAHIVVTGQSVRGGSEFGSSLARSSRWTVKQVIDAPLGARPWKAGVDLEHAGVHEWRRWNPFGRVQVESPDATDGVWTVAPPSSDSRKSLTTASAFVEKTLLRGAAAVIRGGGRLDWQTGTGLTVSPRLSAGTQIGAYQVSGGGGLFVQPLVPEVLATAALRGAEDGFMLVPTAGVPTRPAIDPGASSRIRSEIAAGFHGPRHVVLRGGVQRRIRSLQLGVDHTWTFGMSLPGSVRRRDGTELVDVLNDDRSLRRRQTHVRGAFTWHGHSVTGRYEHVRSHDDTDGAFSFPAVQTDVTNEWAPSAVIPAHTATLIATFRMPWTWRVSVTADARAGSRFTILSGKDEEGLGTFTGRAGLPRNAGTLPSSRSVSASATRQIRLKLLHRTPISLGLRADNLLNRKNLLFVGRVIGSPLYGQPLSAGPGRSVRVWATLAR